MRHPLAGQCIGQYGKQQGSRIWHHQTQVTVEQPLYRVRQCLRAAEALRRQKARHDKEDLDCHAGRVCQPVDQCRCQRAGVVGHRPVKAQVMQHDKLAGRGLEQVNGRPVRG